MIDILQVVTLHRQLYNALHQPDVEHWVAELDKVYEGVDPKSAVDHLRWAEAELEETTHALGYHDDAERNREIGIATAIRNRALSIVHGIEQNRGMESDGDAV